MVTPGGTRRLGSRDLKPFFYPVPWSDAVALTEEACVPDVDSRAIEEVLHAGRMIVQASSAAVHYRLRHPRFSREPERLAAIAATEAARSEIARSRDPALRGSLAGALNVVEDELNSLRSEALAESQQAVLQARQTLIAKLDEAITASAIAAALQDLVAGRKPCPTDPPRQEISPSSSHR
jgi:hypothetical protein